MQHEEARELFSDYLDGELDDERAAALRAHVDGCETCRAELDGLRQTVRSLSGLHELPAPGQFVSRVEQTIRRRSRGRFFGPESRFARFSFEWISLAVLLLVALAIYLFNVLDWQVAAPEEPGAGDGRPAVSADAGTPRTPPARSAR